MVVELLRINHERLLKNKHKILIIIDFSISFLIKKYKFIYIL